MDVPELVKGGILLEIHLLPHRVGGKKFKKIKKLRRIIPLWILFSLLKETGKQGFSCLLIFSLETLKQNETIIF